MSENYYKQNLNSQKLFKIYDTEIAEVKKYLSSEIQFIAKSLSGDESVLELGAGYGRVLKELAPFCGEIMGIDISEQNIALSKDYLKDVNNAQVLCVDVHKMDFKRKFDIILCIQNGLSAMKIDSTTLHKITDLLSDNGRAYFSSYSENFWEHRVKWFCEQSEKGLLGKIDMEKTRDGVIVCEDGFRAITHSVSDFEDIAKSLGMKYHIEEVDGSSLFLVVEK